MSEINLIKGDCLVEMKNIPDKSVDMILCDLPYEVLNKRNKHAQWDRKIPFDKLWQQYERIIKDNGVIALFGQGMFTAKLMMSNTKLWRYNLIWDKVLTSGFLNAKRMPLRSHEDICIFYKKLPIYNPQMTTGKPLHGKGTSYMNKELTNNCYGQVNASCDIRKGCTDKFPTSILKFRKPHPSTTLHPTQKPVALLEYLIKTYTNEGDLVLDNCMGSGSTMIACMNTKRNGIGIELNEEYFKIAQQRVSEAKKTKAIQSSLF
jgi:DNA modification methylase